MEAEINHFTAMKTDVENLEKELELLGEQDDGAQDTELIHHVDMLHQKVYHFICIQILKEQKNFILKLFQKQLMNTYLILKNFPAKKNKIKF
mgnify:CR=1 FL=1